MPKRWFVRAAMAIALLVCGFIRPADLGTRLLAGLAITWTMCELVRAEFTENRPVAEEEGQQ